jgi:hypothetical protein
MTEFPRILDVDLSVLTADTEPCPRCHNLPHGPEAPLECEDGRVPSPSWMPWPVRCSTCGGKGDDAVTGGCPSCDGEGRLVVPQEGDRVLWQQPCLDINCYHGSYAVQTAPDDYRLDGLCPKCDGEGSRTVAVSTVQAEPLPILTRVEWEERSDDWSPCFVLGAPDDAERLFFDPGGDERTEDLSALLDGPWGEQWTPGNYGLLLTTEVLDG